jgi:hypothetical protein
MFGVSCRFFGGWFERVYSKKVARLCTQRHLLLVLISTCPLKLFLSRAHSLSLSRALYLSRSLLRALSLALFRVLSRCRVSSLSLLLFLAL